MAEREIGETWILTQIKTRRKNLNEGNKGQRKKKWRERNRNRIEKKKANEK
jgi:hypothetical protein